MCVCVCVCVFRVGREVRSVLKVKPTKFFFVSHLTFSLCDELRKVYVLRCEWKRVHRCIGGALHVHRGGEL